MHGVVSFLFSFSFVFWQTPSLLQTCSKHPFLLPKPSQAPETCHPPTRTLHRPRLQDYCLPPPWPPVPQQGHCLPPAVRVSRVSCTHALHITLFATCIPSSAPPCTARSTQQFSAPYAVLAAVHLLLGILLVAIPLQVRDLSRVLLMMVMINIIVHNTGWACVVWASRAAPRHHVTPAEAV